MAYKDPQVSPPMHACLPACTAAETLPVTTCCWPASACCLLPALQCRRLAWCCTHTLADAVQGYAKSTYEYATGSGTGTSTGTGTSGGSTLDSAKDTAGAYTDKASKEVRAPVCTRA